RHGLDAVLVADAPHELERLVLRRAARAVNHGDERGLELAQLTQRAPEVLLALRRLGREELEGEDRLVGRGVVVVDPHRSWRRRLPGRRPALRISGDPAHAASAL